MQRFIKGVRSSELNSMLSIKYSDEKFIEDPPTEEQLRFTVHEFTRMREHTQARAKPAVETPEVKEGERDLQSTFSLHSSQQKDVSTVEVIRIGYENVLFLPKREETNS